MRKFFYLVALGCLAGLGVALMHVYSGTKAVGDTIDAAEDGDASAMADLRDPGSSQGDGDYWVHAAEVYFVGLCLAGIVIRRGR